MVLRFLCSRKKVSPLPKQRNRFNSSSNVRVGVVTIAGCKEMDPDWANQDSYLVCEDDNDRAKTTGEHNDKEKKKMEKDGPITGGMYSVFDGHGPTGHDVAEYCQGRLKFILDENDGCVEATFRQLQRELEENPSINIEISGTTCAMVRIQNNCIETYSVGDSKAVLVRKDGDEGDDDDNNDEFMKPVVLTYDHVPTDATEAERVRDNGGEVCAKSVRDHKGLVSMGPVRVWFQYRDSRNMGLSMTRSIGDSFAQKNGVVCTPSERKIQLDPWDEYVILATDGVFDVLSIREAIDVVETYRKTLPSNHDKLEFNPQEAAERIASMAQSRWPDAYRDDITCCLIKLRDKDGPLFLSY